MRKLYRGMTLKKKNINKKNICDVMYGIRLFSMILFLVFLLLLLPNILQADWQGSLFLGLSILSVFVSLGTLLLKNKTAINSFSYNLIYVGMVCYLILIVGRLFLDARVKLTMIYELDMTYFKTNYLILSFILVGIILYSVLLILEERGKNVK